MRAPGRGWSAKRRGMSSLLFALVGFGFLSVGFRVKDFVMRCLQLPMSYFTAGDIVVV